MNASEQIDELIAGPTDWRRKMLANLRRIIREADPKIVEEQKAKPTFYEVASPPDRNKLFDNELEGTKWRTIDL